VYSALEPVFAVRGTVLFDVASVAWHAVVGRGQRTIVVLTWSS
jgi:hypothetical protein